jgi:hypothetical protein
MRPISACRINFVRLTGLKLTCAGTIKLIMRDIFYVFWPHIFSGWDWMETKASSVRCRPECWRAVAACVALVLIQAEPSTAQGTEPSDIKKVVIDQILACLVKAQEAVLLEDKVECARYLDGKNVLAEKSPTMPLTIDHASVCKNRLRDWRVLRGDTIKVLARQASVTPIDSKGIRIFGAVFCEALDLVGLELSYSLVLEKSIFVDGIEGRSFRTRGDLSLDQGLIFGELYLPRAHIDGTVFANKSLISKLRVLDAEVHGSLLFRQTLILELAAFDTVSLSGELSMRGASFPYLLIQFSKIGGVLDLTESQARCSYHIRKTEVGDLVAVDSGFGTTELVGDRRLYNWRLSHGESGATKSALFEAARRGPSPDAQKIAEDKRCDYSVVSFLPGSFLISDTQVKSSVCLRSFHWLEGPNFTKQKSFITFAGVNVGATASINLATVDLDPRLPTSPPRNRNLEMIGFQTGSLFFHFEEPGQYPYRLLLSGLKFEHVYATVEKSPCSYDPYYYLSDSDPTRIAEATAPGSVPKVADSSLKQENNSDPGSNFRSPRVEEVMAWLSGNALATTQPFAAFVEVFQKHGEDNDAKALRIAKANVELCLKAQRVFGDWICKKRMDASPQGGEKVLPPQRFDLGKLFGWGNDFVSVMFGAFLWLIADNGYHPEKVGWFVVLAIVGFGLYFWFGLRAVGLLPKDKHIILPLGFVFLFDRLLPAYQIREDHYHVASFFKRVPRRLRQSPYLKTKSMRYLWWNTPVVAVSEAERLRIERGLDVLKIIGLVLAVFLVAAINAIVSR